MPVNQADISIVLSGGTDNTDATKSLGGDPSVHIVPGGMDNLFDDVGNDDATKGRTDYRCIYVFNDSVSDTWGNVKVWIESQVQDGSDIFIGLPLLNDLQIINIVGLPEAGSFDVSFDGHTVTIPWNTNLATFTGTAQALFHSVPGMEGVICTGGFLGNVTTLQIGFPLYKFQSLIQLVTNNLTGPNQTQIIIAKLVDGAPINQVATLIDVPTSPPFGVTFTLPTAATPIRLGNVASSEGFPVWVKRVTGPNAIPQSADGFTLRVQGDSN